MAKAMVLGFYFAPQVRRYSFSQTLMIDQASTFRKIWIDFFSTTPKKPTITIPTSRDRESNFIKTANTSSQYDMFSHTKRLAMTPRATMSNAMFQRRMEGEKIDAKRKK